MVSVCSGSNDESNEICHYDESDHLIQSLLATCPCSRDKNLIKRLEIIKVHACEPSVPSHAAIDRMKLIASGRGQNCCKKLIQLYCSLCFSLTCHILK